MLNVFLVLVLFAFIGGLVWLGSLMAAKRSQRFAEAAQSLGLTFGRGPFPPGAGPLAMLSAFPIFDTGHSREVRNFLGGPLEGGGVLIFDYSYATGSGKQQNRYSFTAVLINGPDVAAIPALSLYPENIFSKIGAVLGGQDIDFPEYPEFSRRFVLKAVDEARVRALMDPPTAAFFEAHQGVTVDAAQGWLLYRHGYAKADLPVIRQLLDDALLTSRTLAAAAARGRR